MNSGSFGQTTTSWLIEKTGGLIKLEVYASRKSLLVVLGKFKECVRENRYVVTLHGEEEMDEDGLFLMSRARS